MIVISSLTPATLEARTHQQKRPLTDGAFFVESWTFAILEIRTRRLSWLSQASCDPS